MAVDETDQETKSKCEKFEQYLVCAETDETCKEKLKENMMREMNPT